jgi:alpha-glutamyl/putrescinyl thymine pyrophosphorylase-like protein
LRARDRELAERLTAGLIAFDRDQRRLPGIHDAGRREALVEQLVESARRVKYVEVVRSRDVSDRRADPNDELFDPLKAAIVYQRQGRLDEAFWMIFLFVHFGRHPRAGWGYARAVYGRLGDVVRWDWARVSADPAAFREWLHAHQAELKAQGRGGGFGNHRKYESLDAYSPRGTGAAVETYVAWVRPPPTHQELIEEACERAGGDPRKAFDDLYRSMKSIASFGRLARFDYLTMLGKLGLARIEPVSAYMQDSSGPLKGARLMFGGDKRAAPSAAAIDSWLLELDGQLHVGVQVLEDALCNWQKSPDNFVPFRG